MFFKIFFSHLISGVYKMKFNCTEGKEGAYVYITKRKIALKNTKEIRLNKESNINCSIVQ